MEIPLRNGGVALVDDDCADLVAGYKWYGMHDLRFGGYDYVRGRQRSERCISLGRLITGAKPGEEIDHINHDGFDNRRCNLRICTRKQNMRNTRGRSSATSQYKGVCWRKSEKKWRAQIRNTETGKRTHLGYFANELDAARAYNVAALRFYGEFAYLNTVGEECDK